MAFSGFDQNVVPSEMNQVIPLAKKDSPARIKMWLTIGFIAALIVASFIHLSVNPLDILTAPPTMLTFMADNFFPPNTEIVANSLPVIIETFFFAVIATYVSAVISFTLGILMSERLNRHAVVRRGVRYFVAFLRNIPVIIWGSLLVFIFGIGNIVGLIALTIATMGFLSRSYAESMNDIAGERLEAMYASGASYMQILVHGLIPEFMPAWLNWTLFSFEINIRASAILGMVGAGGMGMLINSQMNLRNFRSASMLIMILVGMILITEFTVGFLRRKMT
ncbi:MAG: ABC transporter permease subunit [Turicibacter sp.]|nr:ABC transporter permease subunit [Turicibacter sp.]